MTLYEDVDEALVAFFEFKIIRMGRTVGILPRPALNGVAVEYYIIPDILPARSPTVIWNCRLLPVPYATIHAIDTSDLHSVASQDEKPTRSPAVCHIAKLVHVTVKLTDPVDPVLIDDTLD